MPNPWPIAPITPKDLDFAVVNYNFSGLTADSLSDEPSIETLLDSLLADFATSLAEQTIDIAVLFDGLDDLLAIIGEIDASPLDGVLSELATTATAADATLNDFQTQITPATTSSGGSGSGGTPTQSANCGTHGQSTISLNDDTGDCFASTTLPVAAIADGPCNFVCVMDGSCFAGKATVTGITLLSGDSKLFSAVLDTVTPQGSSTPVSRVTFTTSPYKTGHFLAKFTVHTSTRNPTEIWCVIVDVIQGTSSGSGGGGTGGSGGSGGKGGTA